MCSTAILVLHATQKQGRRKNYFGITHSYQKETILYIGISVISNIHLAMSLF